MDSDSTAEKNVNSGNKFERISVEKPALVPSDSGHSIPSRDAPRSWISQR